jgi:hypothetical protein
MLHPELGQLQVKYDELVSSVEQGHISYQDAVNVLNSMVALDAAGFEWRIDADGNFTKAFPGQQPITSDPKTFSPAGVVTGSAAAPGGWGAPGGPASGENWGAPTPDLSTPPFGVTPQGYDNSDHTGRSPQSLPLDSSQVKSSKLNLPNIDFAKKKTVLIVGGAVILGLILIVASLGRQDSEELTSVVPKSSETVTQDIPLTDTDEVVVDGEGDASDIETIVVEAPGDVITVKEARNLVKNLQTGKISNLNKNIQGDLGNKIEVTGFLDAATRYGAKVKVTKVEAGVNESVIILDIKPKSGGKSSVWRIGVTKEGKNWVVNAAPSRVS